MAKILLFADENGVPLRPVQRSIDGTYCRDCGGRMNGDHHVDPLDDADHSAVAEGSTEDEGMVGAHALVTILILSLGLWGVIWLSVSAIDAWIQPWL